MTPRRRGEAVMRGERPDRLPCDWGTAAIAARLKQDLDCPTDRALWERLGVDKLRWPPVYCGVVAPVVLEGAELPAALWARTR